MVVLLPPLHSHYRYLTHQLVSQEQDLFSFSVGQGEERRTVISSKEVKMNFNSDKKSKVKRPDQPLYVPKRLRVKNGEHETCLKDSSATNKDHNESTDTDIINESTDTDIINESTDTDIINESTDTDIINESTDTDIINDNNFKSDALQEINSQTCSSPETNNVSKTKNVQTSATSATTSTKNFPSINKLQTPEEDIDDEDSWFSKFTDDGEAVDPEILEEISDKMGKVVVRKAVINYLEFSPQEIDMSDEEYGHLLEIYDFPKEFATQDLMLAFKDYQAKGFDIKWVDDTHAIAIFGGRIAASRALKTLKNAYFKVQPISQASRQTKLKVKRCTELVLPHKPRPEMSVHVARNLLAAALGIKPTVSKEQRAEEHQKINKAREKKKADLKSRVDAWEGNFNT